jgi:hypothetical protein
LKKAIRHVRFKSARKIVNDNDLMSGFAEKVDSMRSDVSGAAGYEYFGQSGSFGIPEVKGQKSPELCASATDFSFSCVLPGATGEGICPTSTDDID